MIYVDSSVLLARVLTESPSPPPGLWAERLMSSRLTTYEVWTVVHSRGLTRTHAEAAEEALQPIDFLEMTPEILSRALDPFPIALRTLDALHIASIEYLRSQRVDMRLATYDARMIRAAEHLKIRIFPLG